MVHLPQIDGIMVRYNAAHVGAERDVFPTLGNTDPAVIAFTATRWGSLLDPSKIPATEPVPRASDCYRFVLSHPSVHTSLAGPKDAAELRLAPAWQPPLTREGPEGESLRLSAAARVKDRPSPPAHDTA